jgi:hypothetical protein
MGNVISNIVFFWSAIGYVAFICFYIWDTRYNSKYVGSGSNRVKVSNIYVTELEYWIIIILCGPAVTASVIIVILIDYYFHGNDNVD